ncbi:MAG: serine acetyltransferase [Bacteroidales bacterium]|nr:serine acetyltransferase [Bacteroidales bacterium]
MKNIVIYGAGGFGREIACLLNAINEVSPTWNLLGFVDDGVEKGIRNSYGEILGGIDFLQKYSSNLSVAIAIANPTIVRKLFNNISNPLIDFPNLIAPNVILFDKNTIKMGQGNIIFFGCRLSCDVTIGDFNLFNGAVSLGHDVSLGNFNILSPSTRISGDCTVGDENFFGVQAIVLQGKKIGNNTRIGTNSVVMRDTKDGFLYFGNPAKKMTL